MPEATTKTKQYRIRGSYSSALKALRDAFGPRARFKVVDTVAPPQLCAFDDDGLMLGSTTNMAPNAHAYLLQGIANELNRKRKEAHAKSPASP